jgi:rRNA processing protein Gar1
MDFLGIVSELSSDGRAVTIAAEPPEMGDPVFNADKRKVGKIIRIFGPVDKPYVSVKADNPSEITVGMGLYIQEGKKNVKNKRRHRRN